MEKVRAIIIKMEYITDDMNNEDLLMIRKEIRNSYVTGIIASLMISIVYLLIRFINIGKLGIKDAFVTSAIITGVIFITSLITKNLKSDLSNGVKNVLSYKILDKLSFLDDDPGLGGLKMKYYLLTSSKRFPVDEKTFVKAIEGDTVIEHQTPKAQFTLKVEVYPHRY